MDADIAAELARLAERTNSKQLRGLSIADREDVRSDALLRALERLRVFDPECETLADILESQLKTARQRFDDQRRAIEGLPSRSDKAAREERKRLHNALVKKGYSDYTARRIVASRRSNRVPFADIGIGSTSDAPDQAAEAAQCLEGLNPGERASLELRMSGTSRSDAAALRHITIRAERDTERRWCAKIEETISRTPELAPHVCAPRDTADRPAAQVDRQIERMLREPQPGRECPPCLICRYFDGIQVAPRHSTPIEDEEVSNAIAATDARKREIAQLASRTETVGTAVRCAAEQDRMRRLAQRRSFAERWAVRWRERSESPTPCVRRRALVALAFPVVAKTGAVR